MSASDAGMVDADLAAASPPSLSVQTTPLSPGQARALGLRGAGGPAGLAALAGGRRDAVSWVRHGRGLVGWGCSLALVARGEQRIERLRAAWRATVYASWWRDPLVRAGTGPVALGAISFSGRSRSRSVLVVPRVLVGADEHGAWLTTTTGRGCDHPAPDEVVGRIVSRRAGAHPGDDETPARIEPGSRSDEDYLHGLARVRERLRSGELRKVVIARDVLVRPARELAAGDLVHRLAAAYPSCWTFSVDGLVGATPELLVRLEGRRLFSRVLAGTARRRAHGSANGPREGDELARWLEASGKNTREHALARQSAISALTPLCSVVEAPDPFVLRLPNVLHLASDITGVVAGDTGALSLVGALHPTAAVGGTPTPGALQVIEELEGMDRARYAGPVGWVDWHGEGEWGIALRSGELTGLAAGPRAPARVFAGGGIMPDSSPEDELAETRAKMRPMLTALGAR